MSELPRPQSTLAFVRSNVFAVNQIRPYGSLELASDRFVHVVGVALGLVGAGALTAQVAVSSSAAIVGASVCYATALVAMLSCSAAYNLASPGRWRQLLRRADHAVIFLMIAGTYTPLTVRYLDGAWLYTILSSVWIGAIAGAAIKFVWPERFEAISIPAYLGLGLLIVLALGPFLEAAEPATLALIFVGAFLYCLGTAFHLWAALPFQNAIWHALVLAAASCHFAAIWLSVSPIQPI
jgi:hemolysin III